MKLSFKKFLLNEEQDAPEANIESSGEQNSNEEEQQREIESACDVSLDGIFVKLHEAAVDKVKNFKITNSAIDDESNKLVSAGHHIISVTSEKEGEKIKLGDAIEPLKTYVQWFAGPDIAEKVVKDKIWPLKTVKESYIPSFKEFLLLEAGDPSTAGEDPDGPDQDDVDAASQASDEAAEEADPQDQEKANYDAASAQQSNAKSENDQKDDNSEEVGWYIVYEMKIVGQKETPLSDAIKSFTKGIFKGLGVQGFGWKTGAKGKEHTIGDLIDSLDKVFGKIDPNELKRRFQTNAMQKFKPYNPETEYWDKNTLFQHLKKVLDKQQREKIKSANYSLTLRVNHSDKSAKLINTTVIADMVTRSIKGIFKKFKHQIKKDDVVLVNSYSGEKQVEPGKVDVSKVEQGKVEGESQDIVFKLSQLLFETVDPKLRQSILKRLSELGDWQKTLSEYNGDLTGGAKFKKDAKNGSHSKGDPITNKWVISALQTHMSKSGLMFTIQDQTWNAIGKALDEIESTTKKKSMSDLVDEFLTYVDKIDFNDENVKNSTEYKKLSKQLNVIPNLKKSVEIKDKKSIESLLSNIDKRSTLLNITNAMQDLSDSIDFKNSSNKKIQDRYNDIKKSYNEIKDNFTTDPNDDNYVKDKKDKVEVDKYLSDSSNIDINKLTDKQLDSLESIIDRKFDELSAKDRAVANKDLIDKILKFIKDNELEGNDKYLTDQDFNESDYRQQIENKKSSELNVIYNDLRKKVEQKKKQLVKDLNKKVKSGEYTEEELKSKSVKELQNMYKPSVKTKRGSYDFYIIPMKGLKFDNTDDEDENAIAGKEGNK